MLSSDIPWDSGSTWSTMALYFFSFHIPLSFGGLSVIAQVLQQPVIDPQTEVSYILLPGNAFSNYGLEDFVGVWNKISFMGTVPFFHSIWECWKREGKIKS